ncbi:MAG TPA: cell division protein FtsB [Lautropia sp.]|nr:cell division protein FtsB [Lautropia sp.]
MLAVVLASLLALIQYPLWVGHGSWLRVWELDRQLALQQEVNAGKRMRNEGLEAEAADLRNGTLAIEERARYELGMVKRDEIFVQFNAAGLPGGAGGVPAPAGLPQGAGGVHPHPSGGPALRPSPDTSPGPRGPGEGGTGSRRQGVEATPTVPPGGEGGGVLAVGR